MQPSDIRALVRRYLNIFDDIDRKAEEDAELLPVLLDQLAFAQHFMRFTFDPTEYPDSPRRDQAELRAIVSRRFPDFGFYNVPESVTKDISESKCMVADAIDDLLDIYNDLQDVEWRWSNTSEADALWHFEHSYSSHWQGHLRGLQFYILSRRWEAA
jgi:hypothetical protein